MQKTLILKIAFISLIAILLNIPLSMIAGKSDERSSHQSSAKQSIAKSWTAGQTLIGPYVTVPYTVEYKERHWDKKLKDYKEVTKTQNREAWLLAETLAISSTLDNDLRYFGIYEVPVYKSSISLSGRFDKGLIDDIAKRNNVVSVGQPRLAMTLSDPRGINSIPVMRMADQEMQFEPGSLLAHNVNGIHVELSKELFNQGDAFQFTLDVRGMEQLSFLPIANQVDVEVQSNWEHPSFNGAFLPVDRQIGSDGYKASWKVTSYASNIREKLENCRKGGCSGIENSSFGVKHIEPVDVYLQTERSVKYGFLFIFLSFIAFFVFEVLKSLSIHPIQYGFVGAAIAIFYLLLLALSEHLDFALSYLIACLACVSVIYVYLTSMLDSKKSAAIFSLGFITLYGLLYLIIRAEDFALLTGSALTFVLLAITMIATRKLDWFEVGEQLQLVKAKVAEKTSTSIKPDEESLLL